MPPPDLHLQSALRSRHVVAETGLLRTDTEPLTHHRGNRRWGRPWPRLLATACPLYAGVLLWATHAPRISPPHVVLGPIPSDKSLHLAAYAVLGTLTALTSLSLGRNGVRAFLCLSTGLAVFACADEITQPMCGRTAEALDWVADMAGAVTAVTLVFARGRLTQLPSAGDR